MYITFLLSDINSPFTILFSTSKPDIVELNSCLCWFFPTSVRFLFVTEMTVTVKDFSFICIKLLCTIFSLFSFV